MSIFKRKKGNIFCRNCKFFEKSKIRHMFSRNLYCNAPQNLEADFYASDSVYKKFPEDINKYNTCTYFKKKEKNK